MNANLSTPDLPLDGDDRLMDAMLREHARAGKSADDAFLTRLAVSLEAEPEEPARGVSLPAPPTGKRRSHRLAWSLGLAAMVALAAGLLWKNQPAREASTVQVPEPVREASTVQIPESVHGNDLLLSTVKPDLLRLYPAAVLLGDHQLEPAFRQCLLDYLKGGGHLVLNQRLAGQLGPDLETFRQAGRIWVEEFTRDPAAAQDLLDRLARLYLPVEVKGDIEYTLNRTPKGWIVGLLENKGAWKEPFGPVVFNAAMSPTVTIRPRHGQLATAREWVEEKGVAVADNTIKVRVPPGNVRIVDLTVK